jgi:hypothetical protein
MRGGQGVNQGCQPCTQSREKSFGQEMPEFNSYPRDWTGSPVRCSYNSHLTVEPLRTDFLPRHSPGLEP